MATVTHLQFFEGKHVFQDDNLVPFGTRIRKCLWIIVVPVGQLAAVSQLLSLLDRVKAFTSSFFVSF